MKHPRRSGFLVSLGISLVFLALLVVGPKANTVGSNPGEATIEVPLFGVGYTFMSFFQVALAISYLPVTLVLSPALVSLYMRHHYGNTAGIRRYLQGSAIPVIGLIILVILVLALVFLALGFLSGCPDC